MWSRRSVIGAISIGALISFAGPVAAQETYIPLVSKGFQHQFWQAVKAGAEQAAKDHNVRITFEGPDSETMVDKQIDMLSAALAKNPKAIGFAALDSQAAIPLLRKAQIAKIPVVAFDSGVDSDIPVHSHHEQFGGSGIGSRQDGRADRRSRRHRPRRARSNQPHGH
jgi:ribose transport system substrate-binding protein